MITHRSQRTAGTLLVVFPTVIYGGVSLLMLLTDRPSAYMTNALRQNLFRAGHAHAGVLLVLSLVALRYVDDSRLSDAWKSFPSRAPATAEVYLAPIRRRRREGHHSGWPLLRTLKAVK